MSDKNATEMLAADDAGISRAAEILRSGGLVALPTETVYGLAARADSDAAVARIFEAKGRPSFNPLIVHAGSLAQARQLAEFTSEALHMAGQHWPGPLTLVLPKKIDAPLAAAVTAGLDSVAIRVPAHPIMRRVIDLCGMPLAAPSANRSNTVSPTSAQHVRATLHGRIEAILDGGASTKGIESNILALRQDATWEELRPGPLKIEGVRLPGATEQNSLPERAPEAPGQLAKHYSPGKPVRLNASDAAIDEFMIGFGDIPGDCMLSQSGNLEEAAARLFAALHEAAGSKKPRVAVAPIPDQGIGRAINDRLRRAAA